MAIISFNGFDTFEKFYSIDSLISKYKEILTSCHTVELVNSWVVFFYFLNRFVRVDFFAVNGTLLICSYKHILVPYYRSVVDFSRIENF